MFLYGFNISGNSNLALNSLYMNDKSLRQIEVNYYKAPWLYCYTNNYDEIQHYYLPNKTIIYNKKGQLLEISKDNINFYSKFNVSNNDMEYIMFISAFPYLLRFNNQIALHGTAITYKNEAVIFLGKSGSWKSTLSFALTQQLCENVLSDDLIAVSDDSNYVFKGIQKVRLFETNFSIITQKYNKNIRKNFYVVDEFGDKVSVFFSENNILNKYKIRKIYILYNNRMEEKNFVNTDIKIVKKQKNLFELFQNIKCWQSINGLNLTSELTKLQDLDKNGFVRLVTFNSIENKIDVNISEVVEAIINDIVREE